MNGLPAIRSTLTSRYELGVGPLREALSQFIAHRCDVLPVVDEQGEACGTLHFADLLGEEVRHARTS